eukprot:UN20069
MNIIFVSLKKLKNMNIAFLASLNKFKEEEFFFLFCEPTKIFLQATKAQKR